MKNLILILIFCLSIGVMLNANALSLGGSKSGKKFNYEACGKIVEGKMTYQEAEKILKGKPMVTGKSGKLFYRKYYYEKGSTLGLSKLGLGASQGKSISYECVVLHNNKGVVTGVDMTKGEGGGSGVGF